MSDEQPVVIDDEDPEWAVEDFRQPGVPFEGPQPITREATTIRLSPDVLAALRAGGPGWQTRADAILRQVLLG